MAVPRCKAPSSLGLEFPISDDILAAYLRPEEELVQELLLGYTLETKTRDQIRAYSRDLLNAIRNATGALIRHLPATPDKVLAAIREVEAT